MTFIPRNDNSIHRKDLNLKDPWAPRYRLPNEAPSPSINIYELPVYKPEPPQSVRRGADDHKQYGSRG